MFGKKKRKEKRQAEPDSSEPRPRTLAEILDEAAPEPPPTDLPPRRPRGRSIHLRPND